MRTSPFPLGDKFNRKTGRAAKGQAVEIEKEGPIRLQERAEKALTLCIFALKALL